MKNDKILDSMEYINSEIIEEADTYVSVRKKSVWLKWSAIAACFCLVVAGTIGAGGWLKNRIKPDAEPMKRAELNDPEGSEAASSDNSDEGIYIPAVELPDNTDNVQYDMIALVVYNGGIYTQSEAYYGDDALEIDSLVGDYLGYATGSIDEWSTKEEYSEEFASSIPGEVYTVNGYDKDFRICIREEYEDENGEKELIIQFLDHLNGITLTSGADLFESRLRIQDRIAKIQWQSHDDWNYGKDNFKDADFSAELDSALWKEFLNQIDNGSFVYTWDENLLTDPENRSIYDTPNQAHIYLTLEDGTVIRLRLIEGGYVGYDALGWYFVQIPGDTFDAVYTACGGTVQEISGPVSK